MVKTSLTLIAAASSVLSVAAFQPSVNSVVTARQAIEIPRTKRIFMSEDDGGVSSNTAWKIWKY